MYATLTDIDRARLRDLQVPAMAALEAAPWTHSSPGLMCDFVHEDATCPVYTAEEIAVPGARHDQQMACLVCATTTIPAILADLGRLVAGYPYVDDFYRSVAATSDHTTYAGRARAEQRIAGGMLALGLVPWTQKLPFDGLLDPATQRWAAPRRAALVADVGAARAKFRAECEQWEWSSADNTPTRLMFVADTTTELLNSPNFTRNALVAYDWVASGARWAVVQVPEVRTRTRYFQKVAGTAMCADFGPADGLPDGVWDAFAAVFVHGRTHPSVAFETALTIASAPALAGV